MRICILGKFPPIQGGVSMRTYWSAHALATRGHEVHVVTNAKEVRPPFRMHMRPQDWARCEAGYGVGSVTVHWTDPVDRSQSYIPMASPFVSKLAAIAAQVHSVCPFDVIFSFYMEPYGVAGFLAAQITGAPHVVRMAGSDAGLLWHHRQLEALYDHVLRSAQAVIVGSTVAKRAIEHGVSAERIVADGEFLVPEDLFNPVGPVLDLAGLRAEVGNDTELSDLLWGEFQGGKPHFGIYGKLGDKKGSFALLDALHQLKSAGLDIGLVALAHGARQVEEAFRERARQLGLIDRVLQIPFLPHWRVPEFLRGCLAVCCLEQDFPIAFHSPMIAREVLQCGSCLVASTELIRKIPNYRRLPHGYGCVAIEDVNDIGTLSDRLAKIVRDPGPAKAVGRRGSTFARELQRDVRFPQRLERILQAAVAGTPVRAPASTFPAVGDDRLKFTRLAAAELARADGSSGYNRSRSLSAEAIDLAQARDVLAALERGAGDGKASLRSLADAVRVEIAVATAENETFDVGATAHDDPLFGLSAQRWAIDDGDLADLVPVRDQKARLLKFDYDVSEFVGVQTVAALPSVRIPRSSYMLVFTPSGREQPGPLVIDGLTARVLELCDGTRTVAEIAGALGGETSRNSTDAILKWIENLFVRGLVRLRDPGEGAAQTAVGRQFQA
jgi:glycosyltransferase involved in cell wall biosynthesis